MEAPGQTFEQVTLTFVDSDATTAAETIIFDGQTVTLSAPAVQGVIPSEDVTYQFATQFGTANWEVASYDLAAGTVTLQATVPGNLTDVVTGDITGTYVDGTAPVGVAVVDGAYLFGGTPSSFTVDFSATGTAASAVDAFTFDGQNIAYAIGDGSITLAAKIAAGVYPNWTAVDNLDGSVTFTAAAVGATAIATAADFDLGTNTIVGTISGTVGTADTTTAQFVTTAAQAGPGLDYLDFSSYGVDSVYVDSDFIFGDVVGDGALAANENYVYMVESATNDGEYTMYLMNTGSAAGFGGLLLDVTVGVIGVADFGVEQAFVAENFII